MGGIYARVSDEVEIEFRKKVLDVKGARKRAFSEAVEEALRLWIEKHSHQ